MTAQAESRRAYDAPWVDLSGLPEGLDPYAARVSFKDLKTDDTLDHWLSVRRTAVTASEIAIVLGESTFKTPYALYQEKIGEWEPDDISDREEVRAGNDLEDYVAQRFANESGLKVRRDNFIRRSRLYPWMLANLDRIAISEGEGEIGPVECKTSLGRYALKDDAWGETPGGAPAAYVLQLMHQQVVMQSKIGYIPALITGPRFPIYEIPFDKGLADIITQAAWEFFERLRDGNPPPVTSLDDAKRAYPTSTPDKPCQASDDVMQIADQLRAASASKNASEKLIKTLQGQLAGFMADADTLMYRDRKVLTYKSQSRKEVVMPATTFRVFRFAGEEK